MKIAMIGQKGIPAIYGGIERHVEELSRELGAQGHEILVYARNWYTQGQKQPVYPGVRAIVLPTIHTKHLDAIVGSFVATIHAIFTRPDVIHYHGVGPSLLSWIPRLLAPRVKVVATFHCIDRYHQKWGAIAKFFLRLGEKAACFFPHQTIAVSKTIQNYCLNEYQTATSYIPNGAKLPTAFTPATHLKQFGLEPGRYILMVSRLVAHKGAHYLLAAWQYACKLQPRLNERYKLVIVGGSTFTDSYVETLHTMAEYDKSVVFTDWQNGEALAALYKHAALLVHPSENEGLPFTVLEAMAEAKAVLVSDIPEHQELITDTRFLFKTASVGSLSEKLLALLPQPKLLGEAGACNRALVAAEFNWARIAERTLHLYQTNTKTEPAIELQIA